MCVSASSLCLQSRKVLVRFYMQLGLLQPTRHERNIICEEMLLQVSNKHERVLDVQEKDVMWQH